MSIACMGIERLAKTVIHANPSAMEPSKPFAAGIAGDARARIIEAALLTLAERGIAGTSYRQIAVRAGVSLALVNYHYPEKAGLIDAAAELALADLSGLDDGDVTAHGIVPLPALRDHAAHLLRRSTAEDKAILCARAEILLDAVRCPRNMSATQRWTSRQLGLLAQRAARLGWQDADMVAHSFLDLVTGLQFFALALDLSGEQVAELWKPPPPGWLLAVPPEHLAPRVGAVESARSAETRTRIMEAAIELLVEQGASGIGFRPISEKAGLSTTAPAYHFRTVDALLSAAEVLLVSRSKERYRKVMRGVDREALSLDQLVEVTATVFIREATEYASVNLAFFSNWVEASRRPELQGAVQTFIRDIYEGWRRLFEAIVGSATAERVSLPAFAIFLGKLIRVLSTGSSLDQLTAARREFAFDFGSLCGGTSWVDPVSTAGARRR